MIIKNYTNQRNGYIINTSLSFERVLYIWIRREYMVGGNIYPNIEEDIK